MSDPTADWESRASSLWAELENLEEDEFHRRIEALVGELGPGSAVASFERGAAQDSTGHPDLAVPLYQAALEAGISGERRRRTVIQMASSLRNLGDPGTAVELLEAESRREADGLEDAVGTFLALALTDVGREREAVSVALTALSAHLPRYNGSAARYARELIDDAS
jgi:hypothetical protein